MPSNRRHRDRKPARRKPIRDAKPIILIVCEGKRTEPEYLRGFQKSCRNPRVQIEIADERGVPLTLVQLAKKMRAAADSQASREADDNLRYDSVWCVFDVDEHPHLPDAVTMARDNGIHLAISNPCFELWLLLHFRESPGMKNRGDVAKLLKKTVPDYDKQVTYSDYETGYADAVKRAKRLTDAAAKADEGWRRNPTTNTHELTELIRGDA